MGELGLCFLASWIDPGFLFLRARLDSVRGQSELGGRSESGEAVLGHIVWRPRPRP